MRYLVACLMLFPTIANAQADAPAAGDGPTEPDGRAFRAGRHPRRSLRASGRREKSARQPHQGRAHHGCALHAPDVGRQRVDVAAAHGGRDATRPRASRLLPDQPRALVAARRQCDFHTGRPAEAGGCEFLSVGRDEIRRRDLGEWPRRRRSNRCSGLLHDDPARCGRKIHGRAVQPRVPGRARRDGAASSRCGCGDCGFHAEGISRSQGRTLSHRTTTTPAMSPG